MGNKNSQVLEDGLSILHNVILNKPLTSISVCWAITLLTCVYKIR